MLIELNLFFKWFSIVADVLTEHKTYLTELDSPIGDADHGENISRGFSLVRKQIEATPPKSIKELLKQTAMIMMTKVGGASGMLYGSFFLRMSQHLKNDTQQLDLDAFVELLEVGVNGIIDRGRAKIGDKTMIDVWSPFIKNLQTEKNKDLSKIINQLVSKAKQDMINTTQLLAKKGRASYLGERSIGHQDPGATSTYYILVSLEKAING